MNIAIFQRLNHRVRVIPMAAAFAALVLLPSLVAQEAGDFKERLKALDAELEMQRASLHIPGMAVAIVKDDKVVFAKGYGLRDVAQKKPVDTKTVFAIGSTTKAFTSTLVGMMVDAGEMSWDDPVTRFLPKYKMKTDPPDSTILIRDLLCHRTGFRRMGLLWAGGEITPEDVIARGAEAEATAKFRSKFIYNNVTYMTAGICAATLTKGDWDAMVTNRILKPLGMTTSTTSIAEAQKDERLALGYEWDEKKTAHVHQPMRNLHSIRPSGSINSNVEDMAQWLRFQLANGKFGGKQLISQKALAETRTQQIKMGGEVGYGLGWMLRKWKGKSCVEHGGNIDGFAAEVAFIPELNTGFVLLMNVGKTPLQQTSIQLVFDALYGEKSTAEAEGGPKVDKAELVGDYSGYFGPFVNTTFKVSEKKGRLYVNVPGQMNYELKDPDEEGRWYFAVTDTIAVTFNRNDKGKVTSLTMAQGGMTPEYLRNDVEHKPEIPAAQLEPLLGHYHSDKGDEKIEVISHHGRLVVVAGPKQAFTFKPDAKKKDVWVLRARPEIVQLEVGRDNDGTVNSITRLQRGKRVKLMRVENDNADDEQAQVQALLARLLKAHGTLDEAEFAGFRLGGTARFVHQGALGVVTLHFSLSGQHASVMDLGRLAKLREAYDGKNGYTASTISPDEVLSGVSLGEMRYKFLGWLKPGQIREHKKMTIVGEEKVGEEKTTVLKVELDTAPTRKIFVSNKTGLIVKEVVEYVEPELGPVTVVTRYFDFRRVGGVQVASRVTLDNDYTGRLELKMKDIEALKTMPKGIFAKPAFK